jgi:hypothetical protein
MPAYGPRHLPGSIAARPSASNLDVQICSFAFSARTVVIANCVLQKRGTTMSPSRRWIIAAVGLMSLGGMALAQAPAPTRVRGTIDAIDGHELHMTTRSGQKVALKLAENPRVSLVVPIAIDAIKPGSFIGTAAMTQPDGTLKALEVHVFPEAMRGTGEGHRPWDQGAESTMTNGTVGEVKVSSGRLLTLTYKGGEQKVLVPETAPIVTFEKGSLADVKPGAHATVTATHNADETLTATALNVGKDGFTPPM